MPKSKPQIWMHKSGRTLLLLLIAILAGAAILRLVIGLLEAAVLFILALALASLTLSSSSKQLLTSFLAEALKIGKQMANSMDVVGSLLKNADPEDSSTPQEPSSDADPEDTSTPQEPSSDAEGKDSK